MHIAETGWSTGEEVGRGRNAAVAFYPASSSVVRSAKPVANVVKSSRRQCMRAAGDERFGEAPVGEELIGTLACECGDRMDL